MDVNDILIFVRVVQTGSFSKAARILSVPVSTVSRRVAELEKQLGVSLLHRTTRSLKITEVGNAYFEHGKTIASELEKAEALATSLQSIPQGLLKITAPTDFGNWFLGDVVRDFLTANKRVKIDAVLTERVVDLIEEGFDLAVRIGELEDTTHLARKLGDLDLQLYASPGFLKENGEPKTCDELAEFEFLRFTGEDDTGVLKLQGPGGEMKVKISGRASSNNMALIRDLAISGQGIALMPHFLCAEDLKAGRLKVILRDWAYASGPIHVVFPGQRFVLPKVRAFVDHLVASSAQVKWRA